ncbi:metallophosphoesterase family protein [Bacteroidota bacterium]
MTRQKYLSIKLLFIYTACLFCLISNGCSTEQIIDPQKYSKSTENSFIVIGDTRTNPIIFKQHVNNINNLDPLPIYLFHAGDMVTAYFLNFEWKIFHKIMNPLLNKIILYPVAGNHDVGVSSNSRELYRKETGIQGELYYSFTHQSLLFVILSTEEPDFTGSVGNNQFDWLVETLANSTSDRIIVFMHRPLFPQGHYKDKASSNSEKIHEVFKQYGVDIVFAGHEHQFFINDLDGITYVITGGGGAPLHHENGGDFYHFILANIKEKSIILHVINLNGSIWGTYDIPFK